MSDLHAAVARKAAAVLADVMYELGQLGSEILRAKTEGASSPILSSWAARIHCVAVKLAVHSTIAEAQSTFSIPPIEHVEHETARIEIPPATASALAFVPSPTKHVKFRCFEALQPLDERVLVTSLRIAGDEQLVLPEGAGLPLAAFSARDDGTSFALKTIQPGERVVVELFNNDKKNAHAVHLRFHGFAAQTNPPQEPKS